MPNDNHQLICHPSLASIGTSCCPFLSHVLYQENVPLLLDYLFQAIIPRIMPLQIISNCENIFDLLLVTVGLSACVVNVLNI